MPPMQSMFGGMRAAGQGTTTPGGVGKEPEVEGPESEDPSTESKDPSTEKKVRVYPWDAEPVEPFEGYVKPNGPHMPDVHRYRNGRLVKSLGTKPAREPRAYKPTPRNHPVGERTYKEPGQGYADLRASIEAAKLPNKY